MSFVLVIEKMWRKGRNQAPRIREETNAIRLLGLLKKQGHPVPKNSDENNIARYLAPTTSAENIRRQRLLKIT